MQDPAASDQKEKVSRAADLFVDTILDVMILQMIETVAMKPFAKKVVKQLESVIEKTAHALVHKVILKLNNDELWPLVEYLHAMEVEIDGKRYISFELKPDAEAALKQSFVDMENKNLSAARNNLHLALLDVLDQGLLHFYKEPMSLLKLGMIARKIVDWGYAAIHAATKPAIHKIIHDMDLHELESLKNYIDTLVFEIEC